jgi:hypothetical protein
VRRPLSLIKKRPSLAKGKSEGQIVLNPNRHPTLFTCFPLRHGFDHADSLFIATATDTTEHLNFVNSTALVHNKGDHNNTLEAIFTG